MFIMHSDYINKNNPPQQGFFILKGTIKTHIDDPLKWRPRGASMCKFPYSILIVYYSNLILYSLLNITGILVMT